MKKWLLFLLPLFGTSAFAFEENTNSLALPLPGDHLLRIITPDLLELNLVNTKKPDPARVETWDFVQGEGQLRLPPSSEFEAWIGSRKIPIKSMGFKRRVLYAPLAKRDLRILNSLYLQLAEPINPMETIEVRNPDARFWPASWKFSVLADPFRWSPAIHVNQTGYLPDYPKKAMVGYFLGSLGEMKWKSSTPVTDVQNLAAGARPASELHAFQLLDTTTRQPVFKGSLSKRPDEGFPFESYGEVWEADFSSFKKPGEYVIQVPELGVSFPFRIDEGIAAAVARTYELGIYHQRCGGSNVLPFTRFTHSACHTGLVEIPFGEIPFLAEESSNFKDFPRHTAPQLKDNSTSLYPFVHRAKIDVRGGHHDAGDYSKYTLNSAGFIHYLTFAADNFPGAGALDNLGIPESGDGKSDLLQEAKWEADFLANMQDDDGGFYFLVYPRERRYENNVLPQDGDPQIVWPKNTAATAASVAALAQLGSSPRFKQQFPEASANYLARAERGWAFLERALAKYGKDGSYQKLTHYGNEFFHDDELAWAAAELFAATGNARYHKRLTEWMNPADPANRKWGWWHLYEAWGRATRSYAFAARSGRRAPEDLDQGYLSKCENELIAGAGDVAKWSQQSAYGTSFPYETKRVRAAGWYFSMERAFDLAVAATLNYPERRDPRPKFIECILANMNYEQGCNPVNVSYLTGMGWKREREIVHQYAQNDSRVLPPSGIPIGNVQAGFGWLDFYKQELGALSFPLDGDKAAPYPMYDRWGDSFNLTTEFVITDQARGLATAAFLMARTSYARQAWQSQLAQISGPAVRLSLDKATTFTLKAGTLDPNKARVVWEARDMEPVVGPTLTWKPETAGQHWIEVEALWPDGRRVHATTNINVTAGQVSRK